MSASVIFWFLLPRITPAAAIASFMDRYAPSLMMEPTFTDYCKTLRSGFSLKKAATRIGPGWIGKSDHFVSLGYGLRIRLVAVLTEYPLPVMKRSCC